MRAKAVCTVSRLRWKACAIFEVFQPANSLNASMASASFGVTREAMRGIRYRFHFGGLISRDRTTVGARRRKRRMAQGLGLDRRSDTERTFSWGRLVWIWRALFTPKGFLPGAPDDG